MAILDGRTKLSGFESGDTLAQPDDLTGAAGGTADTEIFIEGVRSYGYYSGSTRDGLLYDYGSAQDISGNTVYMWVNCGVAGLLNTKASGGLRARFCGATVTDWFEVNLAGSDDYPDAVSCDGGYGAHPDRKRFCHTDFKAQGHYYRGDPPVRCHAPGCNDAGICDGVS